jgi:hypothetical protein
MTASTPPHVSAIKAVNHPYAPWDPQPLTVSRASLTRRGWVVPLCVVLVTVTAIIVGGNRSSPYRTQASLVVYGQGTAVSPPWDLAVIYAALIQKDDGVARAIARVIHVPPATAANHLSAAATSKTAIITITFANPSPQKSWLGVWAAVRAVTGAHPKAAGIPPHLLRVVSGPGSPSKQSSKLPGGPVPIGIVLGLFLGIGVFLAWERADPRADDGTSLELELGLPVSELRLASDLGAISALPHRWAMLAGNPSGAKVVLVDATRGSHTANRDLSRKFSESGPGLASTYIRSHTPGTSEEDDVEAMTAEFAVLVVARGERVHEIRHSILTLRRLGVEPRWALLVG